jgi:hypothetical protein
VGLVTTIVRAKGPSSARKAALAHAGITVAKATPDELFELGAAGVKLVDASAIATDGDDNDE